MAIKLNTNYLNGFINEHEYALIQGNVQAAHEELIKKGTPSDTSTELSRLPRKSKRTATYSSRSVSEAPISEQERR